MNQESLIIKKTPQQTGEKNTSYVEYDYSFELRINNDIICQRYFNINRFNPLSFKSMNFKDRFDGICRLIQQDLNSKTRVYLYNVCSTFAKEENLVAQQQLGAYKSELFTPACGEFHPDYVNTEVNNISFSFVYNNKNYSEDSPYPKTFSMTREWDANVYPQFIRKNIDISNHQWIQVSPTYRIYFDTCDDDKLKYEQTIKKKIFFGREDLIPQIITIFRDVCSMDDSEYQYQV
jgi:hypothetical protein